jgi:hypothetical protein
MPTIRNKIIKKPTDLSRLESSVGFSICREKKEQKT